MNFSTDKLAIQQAVMLSVHECQIDEGEIERFTSSGGHESKYRLDNAFLK